MKTGMVARRRRGTSEGLERGEKSSEGPERNSEEELLNCDSESTTVRVVGNNCNHNGGRLIPREHEHYGRGESKRRQFRFNWESKLSHLTFANRRANTVSPMNISKTSFSTGTWKTVFVRSLGSNWSGKTDRSQPPCISAIEMVATIIDKVSVIQDTRRVFTPIFSSEQQKVKNYESPLMPQRVKVNGV